MKFKVGDLIVPVEKSLYERYSTGKFVGRVTSIRKNGGVHFKVVKSMTEIYNVGDSGYCKYPEDVRLLTPLEITLA